MCVKWLVQSISIHIISSFLFSSVYFHMNAMMWCDVMCTHIVGSQLTAIISHWLIDNIMAIVCYLFGHFICSSLTWPNRNAVDFDQSQWMQSSMRTNIATQTGMNRERFICWSSFGAESNFPNRQTHHKPSIKMEQWWLRANRTNFMSCPCINVWTAMIFVGFLQIVSYQK